MQFAFKISGLLLLLAIIALPVAALPYDPESPQPAATCHEQEPTPAPQPAHYACCATGHKKALARESFTLNFSWQSYARGFNSDAIIGADLISTFLPSPDFSFASPPHLSALRI